MQDVLYCRRERVELWPGSVLLGEQQFERSWIGACHVEYLHPAPRPCYQRDRATADSERHSHRGQHRRSRLAVCGWLTDPDHQRPIVLPAHAGTGGPGPDPDSNTHPASVHPRHAVQPVAVPGRDDERFTAHAAASAMSDRRACCMGQVTESAWHGPSWLAARANGLGRESGDIVQRPLHPACKRIISRVAGWLDAYKARQGPPGEQHRPHVRLAKCVLAAFSPDPDHQRRAVDATAHCR